MKPSRRDFLRLSAITGTAICFTPFKTLDIFSEAGKFLERIGISTSIANNKILKTTGYSFVEENARGFLVPNEPESVFEQKLALLKASTLPVEACNTFLPGDMKCVGPAAAHQEILKFGETSFRRAQTAGIKTIVFGSGGARRIPEGFPADDAKQQFISLCKKLAPLAMKYNIVISLEPLNTGECNFINSLAEGAEIVQAVNHKSLRLLADVYHMLMENESPMEIIKYGDLIYHTHIAEKTGRSAPGVHKEDFTPYFRALKQANYKGRMTIECSWINLEEQAAGALSAMRSQIDPL
jgi:sugar phosphate isomerase/epimerase